MILPKQKIGKFIPLDKTSIPIEDCKQIWQLVKNVN